MINCYFFFDAQNYTNTMKTPKKLSENDSTPTHFLTNPTFLEKN